VTVKDAPSEAFLRVVARREAGTVLLPRSRRALPMRFEGLDPDKLLLLLFVEPRPAPGPGSVACVQYVQDGHEKVFLTRVREVLRDDDGCFLVLEVPEQVASMESRRAFRVPVAPGDLPVEVVGPDGAASGVVKDLSALGVGITLDPGTDDAAEVGDAVRVRLGEPGQRRVLSGTVIQRSAGHLGIAFTADVPSRIGDLVAEAEARWRSRQRG